MDVLALGIRFGAITAKVLADAVVPFGRGRVVGAGVQAGSTATVAPSRRTTQRARPVSTAVATVIITTP